MLGAGAWSFAAASGVVPKLMGADDEDDTAAELRRLSRHGWVVFHDVHFLHRANTDHVAIGPKGVFVFETKWTAPSDRDSDYERRLIADAAVQASRAARTLWQRLYARPHQLDIAIQPVVVIWGGSTNRPPITTETEP